MNRGAIYQARKRLERARFAILEMRQGGSVDDQMRRWFDFLQAANGVFVKLAKGSQKHPKTRGWYDRLKQVRKKDPLLSYIHHARRVEEHGLEMSIGLGKPEVRWEPLAYVVPPERKGKESIVHAFPEHGRVAVGTFPPLVLKDVRDDQYGDVFPLPTSHMGQALTPMTIPELAELAMNTLKKIIDEAEGLADPIVRKP